MYKELERYQEYIDEFVETDNNITVYVNKLSNYKVNMEIKKVLSTISNKEIEIKLAQNKKINTKTIAFLSGKGGVGKTYVATNYAKLASKDKKVLLLDLDIYGYSVPYLLDTYDEVKMIDNYVKPVKYSDNLDIMSSQYFIKDFENHAIIWRGPKLNQLISLMVEQVDMSKYDLIVIDTPPTTGDIILNIDVYFEQIDYYIITTPKPLDQHVCLRSYEIGKQLNFNFLGYIINQAFYQYNDEKLTIFGDTYIDEIKDEIRAKLAINDEEYNQKQINKLLD